MGRTMTSKRQEKIKANQEEAYKFVRERREVQLAVFESNFKVGLEMYDANKDDIPEEERKMIEAEIEKNREVIDNLRKEWNLDKEIN
jgi:putative cell wall-binding protein